MKVRFGAYDGILGGLILVGDFPAWGIFGWMDSALRMFHVKHGEQLSTDKTSRAVCPFITKTARVPVLKMYVSVYFLNVNLVFDICFKTRG